jgi:hypothetical protein
MRQRRDPIHAMLLGNLLWGIGLGLVFAGGVYALDLGHIRHLVNNSPDGLLAMALLTMGSVITFGSVVMGGAVMMLPRSDDETPRGGKGVLLRVLVPLRVRAAAPARELAHRRNV